jgi:hypothetical protein
MSCTAAMPLCLDGRPRLAYTLGEIFGVGAAFERWAKGDVNGFLDASDPEVDYFDPFIETRLEGLAALRALYGPIQGKIHVDRWEMISPRAIVSGDMGVLVRWNTTEVYRRKNGQWKIVHTHWALTKPQVVDPPATDM